MAPDKFIGAILIPKNKTFTDVEAAGIIALLQGLCLAGESERVYPIFRFEEIADNSEEETVSTLGYGSKQVAKDGKYDWTFRFLKGGLCFQKKLRAFNKSDKKVLFVDSNNVIFGTRASDGNITGFSLDFFYAKPFKAADGSNAAIFQARFALAKPAEFNDNVVYIDPGVDVEEAVKGNIDVELTQLDVTAGKVTVGIKTACDKVDLFDSYPSALAAGSLWKVTKAGVNVTITTVAASTTRSGWDVSFTGTGEHVISLTTPDMLEEGNIGGPPDNGYESNTLTVIMP
ncbi:MAG: hypothetical protein CVU66_00750 [Deltaproteobacteria bacterium HGW-Deltaproteobacteria-23]|nr:MAG: hypothetical protein CVU66_00750 [Deltaproteobacteria bacterium HGW-Deltaproteobacteria-23]